MRFILPVLALAACDPTPGLGAYEAAMEELERIAQTVLQPPNVAGCGDVSAHVYNDADTRAVVIHVDDQLAWDAANSGLPISASYTLPHPDVTVRAVWGDRVTILECNDVLDPNNAPDIRGEADAISGTLHVTVTPQGGEIFPWQFPGDADLELEDVTFEHTPTGAQKTVGSAILEDVFVGWLPG